MNKQPLPIFFGGRLGYCRYIVNAKIYEHNTWRIHCKKLRQGKGYYEKEFKVVEIERTKDYLQSQEDLR